MLEINTFPPAVGAHGAPVRDPCTAPSGTGPVGTERSGHAPLCSCELDTASGPTGPILVLHVAGEIDLVTLPALQHALTAAVDQRAGDLVVDLAAVSFCCVSGFALVADTAATAQTNGTNYAVSGMSPHLDRIATLVWAEQRCVRYRSTAAAVTGIRIDQIYRAT